MSENDQADGFYDMDKYECPRCVGLPECACTHPLIATVRIAPVERWCEKAFSQCIKYGFTPTKYVGLEIAIIPSSMLGGAFGCNGKAWMVPAEEANRIRSIEQDGTKMDRWVCEHMLEMD
jgi:hypothetical protein